MKSFMLIFAVVLVALCASTGVAQIQSASVEYVATVFATPLNIDGVADALYENLRQGVCYTTIADVAATGTVPTNITPYDYTATEAFTAALINLVGSPSAEVACTFILPTRLYPNAAGTGFVDMSYDNRSGGFSYGGLGSVSTFFNPQNGLTTALDGAGTLDIYLGGNPCVSSDAVDGGSGFVNEALMTVEYTGN